MLRMSCFVDFSNLLGSLAKMDLHVEDYQKFFSYVLKKTSNTFFESMITEAEKPTIILNRVYWYAVGNLDSYDFSDDKTRKLLETMFNDSAEIKRSYSSDAGKSNPNKSQNEIYQLAFETFYSNRKDWYDERSSKVKGFCGFYEKVMRQSDFIDISPCGHWKLDFVSKDVDEKGVDTALAVDSVTMMDTYDIAIIVSGDADMIPSINYLKRHGKTVGVVSFIKGHPPEKKGRQQSIRLTRAADFDTTIYEVDLSRDGYAMSKSQSKV